VKFCFVKFVALAVSGTVECN